MNQSDFDDFSNTLSLVAEQYGKSFSPDVIMLYWKALGDFEWSAVKHALFLHIRNADTGMYLPKIADIIKMLDGTTSDQAMVAWTDVEKAMSRVGAYASVVFDDNITQAVIRDMGGWAGMCHKQIDELPFVAKEFQQRYRHYKSTNKPTNHPKVLIGSAEAENQLLGFNSEPPVPIGDKDKARQVYLTGGSAKQSSGFEKLENLTKT